MKENDVETGEVVHMNSYEELYETINQYYEKDEQSFGFCLGRFAFVQHCWRMGTVTFSQHQMALGKRNHCD